MKKIRYDVYGIPSNFTWMTISPFSPSSSNTLKFWNSRFLDADLFSKYLNRIFEDKLPVCILRIELYIYPRRLIRLSDSIGNTSAFLSESVRLIMVLVGSLRFGPFLISDAFLSESFALGSLYNGFWKFFFIKVKYHILAFLFY